MKTTDKLTELGFALAEYSLEDNVACYEHGSVIVSVGENGYNITAVKFPDDLDEISLVVTYSRWDDTLEQLIKKWIEG